MIVCALTLIYVLVDGHYARQWTLGYRGRRQHVAPMIAEYTLREPLQHNHDYVLSGTAFLESTRSNFKLYQFIIMVLKKISCFQWLGMWIERNGVWPTVKRVR